MGEPADETNAAAVAIAAKAAGLRVDQIDIAVREYRTAMMSLHQEPAWAAIMHMSGPKWAVAQYGAADTFVTLEVTSERARGKWREERFYAFAGKPYETFGEARAAELLATARPRPRPVAPSVDGGKG